MFLKAVIVLGALVACQGDKIDPQQYIDVKAAIDLFRDTSMAAMIKGYQKLQAQVSEIEVSSTAAEEKSQKLVDEILKLSYREINISQEEANGEGIDISECIKVTKEELPILLERFTKMVKDCGFNISQECNVLVNKTIDDTGSEAYYRRHHYYVELDKCFNQKDVSCLNNLKAKVNEDTEVYPKILQKEFDQTANSLIAIEDSIDMRFFNVGFEASKLSRNSIKEMSNCIKSRKQ